MGYFSHNLLRLYDLISNSFIKRCNVIFHECVVGHHGFANNRLPMGIDILDQPIAFEDEDLLGESPRNNTPAIFLITDAEPDVPKSLPAAL